MNEPSRDQLGRLAAGGASERASAYLAAARIAASDGDPSAGTAHSPLRTAVVVGGGTMGSGIAMALADAGVAVTLIDPQPAQLERAQATIAGRYAASVTKGRLSGAAAAERIGRLSYRSELALGTDVDVAIEAVFEELDVKRAVFAELDRVLRPRALLASNTSTLDIDALGAATTRPADVIGLHFFSPANIMRLIEIVPGAATSVRTVGAALALCERLGKIGVIAGNADGFIGNRMLYAYRREAEFLLEEGAEPRDVDRALEAFGFAMGPFAVSDLAGLDIGWRVRRRRIAAGWAPGRYSRIADRLCELGRFGQKTGAGYYRYELGSRVPIVDPLVTEIIAETALAAGVRRRTIGDDEIRARCLYRLVNEGAALLADGIARRASDIDLVWVHGYGFPPFRGGPLYFADGVGLEKIVAEMRHFAQAHGADEWRPAPLLATFAAAGSTFTGPAVR